MDDGTRRLALGLVLAIGALGLVGSLPEVGRLLHGQPRAPESPSSVQHVTASAFPALQAQSRPVVVDFWAPWCGPCRMIAPILDELAVELADKARIVKVNVDENPIVASEYGVTSIPFLLLLKDGQQVSQKVGALSKPQLKTFIEQAL